MSEHKKDRAFDSYNAGYVQDLYEQYVRDPESVDTRWQHLFELDPTEVGLIPVGRNGAPSRAQLRAAIAAGELVDAYRLHGHKAARLNPLGGEPKGHPMLSLEYHGIEASDLGGIPSSLLGLERAGSTMRDALDWLRETYTGTIGYEYEHLEDPKRREWLRRRIEKGEHRTPLNDDEKERLLRRLTEVSALEQYLHRAYLGQKRFSIEGNDMLVPALDLAIERAAEAGAREVVLGMAHRGRLNVLAHVLGQPYEKIIAEFEGKQESAGTGDVKYHLGAEGTYATESGDPLTVTMAPNPSHLEFVNPVVEGIARAKQTDRDTGISQDVSRVLPVLMHGDAAFAGQGIVAETLNLARLTGWETGGTLHMIVNNQIGFTTDPDEARSTDYASDLARGFDIPVFHVNADDPEACLAVVRLAMAYRIEFHADVLIDLVGYRRYGHNEGDEPAYTQPEMYGVVDDHPTVRQQWADRLEEDGTLSRDEIDEIWNTHYDRLSRIQEEVKERLAEQEQDESATPPVEPATLEAPVSTTVDDPLLGALDRQLHQWPDDFAINDKLKRQLTKRAETLDGDEPKIDWAHAESLAFASLLAEGTPIRLTGQDSARGTFSQRHLTLRDTETGEGYTPLQNLAEAEAPFEVYNSPLSEAGVLGFEYGYSTAANRTLTLWEAQFGDFVNGAQVILDQFLAAGRAKWEQNSRLVLLLPHGYEGQGPEHSSARLERFLQLAAEDNIRVANVTTPAQYFHLLRRQAHLDELRPLVIFTPKSLLRHPKAVSGRAELTGGGFELALDDPRGDDLDGVKRVVLCSGKVYYDLLTSEVWDASDDVAVVRLEQLYPFPEHALGEILGRYDSATELVWVQEEPANMGAWTYMRPWLERLADGRDVGYVGRPERASPAEGYKKAHDEEQARIVREAFRSDVALPRASVTVEESGDD